MTSSFTPQQILQAILKYNVAITDKINSAKASIVLAQQCKFMRITHGGFKDLAQVAQVIFKELINSCNGKSQFIYAK